MPVFSAHPARVSSAFDSATMLCDNDWIIEYDMELARGLLEKKLQIDPEDVVPEFIFDKGYACWQEMYPGEERRYQGRPGKDH